MSQQYCLRCKKTKPQLAFYPSMRGTPGFPCTECHKAGSEQWKRKLTPTQRDAFRKKCADRSRERGYHMQAKYGITRQKKSEMCAAQRFECAICRAYIGEKRDANIDHCHKTQKIRGVLCGLCNRGIGNFLDRPDLLLKAAFYLEVSQL